MAEFPGPLMSAATTIPAFPNWWEIGEQLIQAVLNIARNAAQAMDGSGQIIFRTRRSGR